MVLRLPDDVVTIVFHRHGVAVAAWSGGSVGYSLL